MRRIIIIILCLVIATVAYPFLHDFVQLERGNHYLGTAQQAGVVALQLDAKSVAVAVFIYHGQYNRWPTTLTEVISEGLLTRQQLHTYPESDDLPDRRDILKMKDFEDWVYVKPLVDAPNLPLIVAPRPFTSSMGKALPEPMRIIVDRETIPTVVHEETIAPILRNRSDD